LRDRPGVIVYVTRAAPFEWELLLFDVVGEPGYQAIVPGGGIEQGETPEDAGVREVLEETGLEVRILRELGVDEGTHFFQAMPVEPADDEWFLGGDEVRCYWAPLDGEVAVWGRRGDLLPELKRQRVVAYITRDSAQGRELLVFEIPAEPGSGVQVPAGRLDPGEELEPALMREIEEESGLTGLRLLRELPGFEEHYPTRYENHGYHLVPTDELPDEWDHVVQGDGDDAGFVFRFRWAPIEPGMLLFNRRNPVIHRLLENPGLD
jgi:8-oxo-dGTP pyrophosphatase MutT (NUDIX family)